MKRYLSDSISLLFRKPEEGESHDWGTIIGVVGFLALISSLASLVS
jgi:hypothetical protein